MCIMLYRHSLHCNALYKILWSTISLTLMLHPIISASTVHSFSHTSTLCNVTLYRSTLYSTTSYRSTLDCITSYKSTLYSSTSYKSTLDSSTLVMPPIKKHLWRSSRAGLFSTDFPYVSIVWFVSVYIHIGPLSLTRRGEVILFPGGHFTRQNYRQ